MTNGAVDLIDHKLEWLHRINGDHCTEQDIEWWGNMNTRKDLASIKRLPSPSFALALPKSMANSIVQKSVAGWRLPVERAIIFKSIPTYRFQVDFYSFFFVYLIILTIFSWFFIVIETFESVIIYLIWLLFSFFCIFDHFNYFFSFFHFLKLLLKLFNE